MIRRLDFEIRHLKRLLGELTPYSIIKKTPLFNWKYFDLDITFPYKWDEEKIPAIFETTVKLERKNPTYLSGWFGGESLVKVDNKPYGEINVYHSMVNLSPFCDNSVHSIKIETVPRTLFGKKEEPLFKEAYLIEFDNEIKKVINYTSNVIKLCEETKNEPLRKKLVELTNQFLYSINNSHSTSHFITKVTENPTIEYDITTTWSTIDFPVSYGITPELKNEILNKFTSYKETIESLNKIFPKIGKVFLVGHAHIDYAWLWPIEETKRKILRTFANAIQLAKRYPYFIFTQSSAQMYEDLEKESPELFKEIKQLIKSGQWEPVGGMWIESDCNIPGTESLIRQFYYGQKYFTQKFGKQSRVCWLPDAFGFSWILPQILKESNIDFFITTKLNWNEANEFPYDLCKWRGIDGSEVIFFSFNNEEGGYGGNISPKTIYSTWNNFKQKDLSSFTMVSVGYGDGGGGPTEEMCENYLVIKRLPDLPVVEFSKVEDFCLNLQKETSKLPVWDNELYLELHRGTLSSQSKIKRLHKKAENAIFETEVLNALFNLEKQSEIDEIWKRILTVEFHDILPGSSIKEVYKETEKTLNKSIHLLNEIPQNIHFDDKENYFTLFNPSSYKQKIRFILPEALTLKFRNKQLNCIKTYDGKYLYALNEYVESLDLIDIKIEKVGKQIQKSFYTDENFENAYIKVQINNDGTFNVYHKKLKKWLFNDRGNVLMLYKDIPYFWENWDIDFHHFKSGHQIKANSVEYVEINNLRKVIRINYKFEETEITQFYILWNDSDILEIKTEINWHHRRSILKAIFPTNVFSRYAKFDIDGGYIIRPTHQNTNFEQARFEVMAQRWVNLSEYDFGVSLINDGKYGHGVSNSTISLTLIKAGIYPDFFSDEGRHEFSYAIKPNEKEDIVEITKTAEIFNRPLKVFRGRTKENFPRLQLSKENFRILSFRRTEKGYVLRIVEIAGSSGKLKVSLKNTNISKVYLTNILEEVKKELETKDNSFELNFKPFKIYTILIK
ncbi:alpha-mannosidase [Thermosipho atlanticus]|uniref:Alpha-mannosidase n=1 Tax=Thermosipho atlanticus DSM 15807 TaxID=1123380 RepID=A0A1M5T5U2_9BACT|nr:glycoside hydrolase family 38 C-terminal domain-containing protein [Thermosipho atlanticus]SHH46072.1 alpha-mannosidase [Thermosipho atlanticus DSM 15807]